MTTANPFPNAQTFLFVRTKADASRVCKRLRDHNVVAGVRSERRGEHEVYGFTPDRMTLTGVQDLAAKLFRNREPA